MSAQLLHEVSNEFSMPPLLHCLAILPGSLLVLAVLLSRALVTPVRRLLSPGITRIVIQQLTWVAWTQELVNTPLDIIVGACSLTVTVEFYVGILPCLYWLGYDATSLQLLLGMTLITHVTCVAKDLFCTPRPRAFASSQSAASSSAMSSLPAAAAAAAATHETPLRTLAGAPLGHPSMRTTNLTYEEVEYGAPSMHVALSLFLNVMLLIHLRDDGVLSDASLPAAHAAALLWVAWIAWGRLYLGVHTPIDLAIGAGFGGVLLVSWAAFVPLLWQYMQVPGLAAPLATLAASWLLLATYPQPLGFTCSYNDTVTWLGASFGLVLGRNLTRGAIVRAVMSGLPRDVSASGGRAPFWALFAFGFVVLAAAKFGSQFLLKKVFPPLLDLAPPALRTRWQPPIGQHLPTSRAAFVMAPTHANGASDCDVVASITTQSLSSSASSTTTCAVTMMGDGDCAQSDRLTAETRGAAAPMASGKGGGGRGCHSAVVLRKANGYPWDADVAARYLTYCAMGLAVAEYGTLLRAS